MQRLKGGNMKNRAKCLNCLDVIESKSRHDFVWCKCKKIFVDGGNAYWRAGGDLKFFRRLHDDNTEHALIFEDEEPEQKVENNYQI